MHEFIKYTVRLEDNILPFDQSDLNSPTDDPAEKELRRRKKSDWQAVLADHQYGTHFFVYAKFLGKLNGDKSSFKLKSVQLFLQNYTGAVTIGLAGKPRMAQVTPQVGEVDASRVESPNKYKLFIPVQAFNIRDVGEETLLNGEEGIEIRPGDLLESAAIYKPVEAEIGEFGANPKNVPNVPFVDELFETRMGEDIVSTVVGDSRNDLIEEFENLDSASISTFNSLASEFDLVGTVQPTAEGAGRVIPCKPTNSVFHI